MTEESRTLDVPGAILYLKTQGRGPLLLIIQGGAGDADGSDRLANELVDAYTVVTYDRRGLSRSTLTDVSKGPTVQVHSDDASRVLASLTAEPALVFGASLGAVIGLDLVQRYSAQVITLVAHEPALPELLPAAERDAALAAHAKLASAVRTGDPAAAMRGSMGTAGPFNDREPDVVLAPPSPEAMTRRAANMTFFLTHDADAAHHHQLDSEALRRAPTRIVPAAGENSGQAWPRLSAKILAELLGVDLQEFPGNHAGPLLRPCAFAKALREVLETTPSSG